MSTTDTRRARILRWSGYIALAIVFAIACVFLSQWQFDRNVERSAQLARIEANYDAEPIPVEDVIAGGFDVDDEWQPVILRGEYLADDELLVRNRPRGGTSAYEVLTPFQLDSGGIVIVNRGWVPPGEGDSPDAVPAPPAGETTVIARLRPSELAPREGRGAPEGQVPTIHLPTIAEQSGLDSFTGAYVLMVSEDPAPAEAAPNALPNPSDDPGPHLSYAIQWILFAIMGFVFIGYVIRTEVTKRREELSGQPSRPKKTRRRDRDAETEDALLDA